MQSCGRCHYGLLKEAGSFNVNNGSAWQVEYSCGFCNWYGMFKPFYKKQELKLEFIEEEGSEMAVKEVEGITIMKEEVGEYKRWNNIWHEWVAAQLKGGPVRCHSCGKKAFNSGSLTEESAKKLGEMTRIGRVKEFKEKQSRTSPLPSYLVELNYVCEKSWEDEKGNTIKCGAKHSLQVPKNDYEQYFAKVEKNK